MGMEAFWLLHRRQCRADLNSRRDGSSWAAFTVHAAEFLRPGGGRLGLVLPAELLTVNYAAEVRRYLMARFGRVRGGVHRAGVSRGVRGGGGAAARRGRARSRRDGSL